MIYGALIFPETLPPERRRAFDWRRANPLGAWQAMRALPGMGGVALVLLLWQVASLVYPMTWRSEEHTSELQSLMRTSYADFCLKKTNNSVLRRTQRHQKRKTTPLNYIN